MILWNMWDCLWTWNSGH